MVASPPAQLLLPRAPFDAAPILGYLSRSPLEPLDVVQDGAYRRAILLDGRPVLLEVVPDGTVSAPTLTVRVLAVDGESHSQPLSYAERGDEPHPLPLSAPERELGGEVSQARADRLRPDSTRDSTVPGAAAPLGDAALLGRAAALVARWWRIEQDPAELDPIVARDPILGALLARLHGARAPLMPSPFECLVWAILGQQITVAFAYKMKRALVERYGRTLTYQGQTYRLFPEASHLAEADPADLRDIQFSRQKSDYVRSLAALVAGNRIPWEQLAAAPAEEAISVLTALRGVGRWTAEYVLMRGLGHPDVIPAADVGLQAAIGRAYDLGRKATEQQVRALAEQWRPRRSHAAYAWWWSLSKSAQI